MLVATISRDARPIRGLLVPIDRTTDTERALEPALHIARRAGVPVVLFTWCRDEAEGPPAKTYLSTVAEGLPDVAIELAVSGEGPAAAIAAAARRNEATVCMATHGRSGAGHAFLGSVAEETLALLDQPCVLVGPSVADPVRPWHAGLVATLDGSQWSERILPVAGAWADQLAVSLTVAHVREPDASFGDVGTSIDQMEHRYLAEIAHRVDASDPPRQELLYGEPTRAITSLADGRADLVAMATHGRTGIARTVLGSVTMRVVHHSRRPVLVFPCRSAR
jgi:nucleotide-binding universal stress UspA family protein